MRGFTTVRDLGGNVFALKALSDSGMYPGPRIFPSGPMIDQTSGHCDFRGATAVPAEIDAPLIPLSAMGHVIVADGVPEVLKRVQEALRMGATQIKVMAGGGVSSTFDPPDTTQYTFDETRVPSKRPQPGTPVSRSTFLPTGPPDRCSNPGFYRSNMGSS
ncbi:amidohydrolase family protein [Cribrihabitans sp. XS_ASV171]